MAQQVNVRVPDDEVEAIDRLVEQGRYANRSVLVVNALRRLLKAERDVEAAEAYRRAYADHPDDEDAAWAVEQGHRALAGDK